MATAYVLVSVLLRAFSGVAVHITNAVPMFERLYWHGFALWVRCWLVWFLVAARQPGLILLPNGDGGSSQFSQPTMMR